MARVLRSATRAKRCPLGQRSITTRRHPSCFANNSLFYLSARFKKNPFRPPAGIKWSMEEKRFVTFDYSDDEDDDEAKVAGPSVFHDLPVPIQERIALIPKVKDMDELIALPPEKIPFDLYKAAMMSLFADDYHDLRWLLYEDAAKRIGKHRIDFEFVRFLFNKIVKLGYSSTPATIGQLEILIKHMEELGEKPPHGVAEAAFLSVCIRHENWEKGKELYDYIEHNIPEQDRSLSTWNEMMTFWSRQDDTLNARRVYDRAMEYYEPNMHTFYAMMAPYIKRGDTKAVRNWLELGSRHLDQINLGLLHEMVRNLTDPMDVPGGWTGTDGGMGPSYRS